MIGAHASFTLSDETLEACVDAARAHGVGIHVHAAEDTADEDDAVMVHGLGSQSGSRTQAPSIGERSSRTVFTSTTARSG